MNISECCAELEQQLATAHRRIVELEKLALTDEMTGLPNRRAFNALYEVVYASARRSFVDGCEKTYSLIAFDVDHFKLINDTHGHVVGDLALQEVARVLRQRKRTEDAFFRTGGEEFVGVTEIPLEGAICYAERIRKLIEREVAVNYKGTVVRLTVSIGVAGWQEGDMQHDTLARADKALYLAKETGRNCVRFCT